MKSSSMSLFEREMRDQVAAAHEAVAEAERRGDPLLLQAAQGHRDGLIDLARRNGIVLDDTETASADAARQPLAAPAL